MATLIKIKKKPETIAAAINKSWLARSMPFIITALSDNSSEFADSPIIEVLELLGIKHDTMLMEGSDISEDVAFSMAVNAYNQMEMKSGYSPAFLVYNTGTTFLSFVSATIGKCH